MNEAEIILLVAQRFNKSSDFLEVGIGDDTAVLKSQLSATARHLLTTDTLIEGVHFDLRYMSLSDVGYKALAVNLSDINAMGGVSSFALGTLGVPRDATTADIDALLDGIEDALALCAQAGQQCSVIGGDTVSAPQWTVGFTVMGQVDGMPLLRSGASVGDDLWHSGTLGLSGIGWQRLASNAGAKHASPETCSVEAGRAGVTPMVEAHIRPAPPLALGPWLQQNGIATAAQDLSDSLSQVSLQLAAASGVGVEFDFRDYAFEPELIAFAQGRPVAELLLAQAEDYQLLFTVPPEKAEALAAAALPLTRIGKVVEAARGSSYIDERGEQHPLLASGFEHF
ncbi:MAG: thiamine-phosphate kinase [bacterium]|nr:thiamine-phosphate kinase [bacterium]